MLGYGQDIVTARKIALLDLGDFTANSTVTPSARFIVPPGGPNVRVLGVHVSADDAANDGDGAMTLNVKVRDASEDAVDTLVSGFDVEGLSTADEAEEATLEADGSEEIRTLEPGDTVFCELVNDSAGIDTNANVAVAIEYILVPRDQDDEDEPSHVGYPSQMSDY